MAMTMVGRCELCNDGFELPLVFDPVTLRTTFDIRAMVAHQAAHQAARAQAQHPRRPTADG